MALKVTSKIDGAVEGNLEDLKCSEGNFKDLTRF